MSNHFGAQNDFDDKYSSQVGSKTITNLMSVKPAWNHLYTELILNIINMDKVGPCKSSQHLI